MTLDELLGTRPYPGRGVLAARTTAGRRCLAYFLTGRSAASRERELVTVDGGDVAVRATQAGAQDDQLRHYVAAARRGHVIVLGNGSQVVPVAEGLAAGGDPLRVFSGFDYEPDEPIFTPRLWIATAVEDDAPCVFGYAVRSARPSGAPDRVAWTPGALAAGEGLLLSTYDGSAAAVSAARAPADFTTTASSPSDLLRELWGALEPDLRVAAMAFDPGAFPRGLEVVSRDRAAAG